MTLNFGMAMPSWYDIVGLDERSNESCEGIDDAAETILGLIRDEVEAGVDYGRIVLSGFSQGEYLRLCVSASSSTLTRILETVQAGPWLYTRACGRPVRGTAGWASASRGYAS